MSRRKLSRFAGLVFALAALVGGAAAVTVEPESAASQVAQVSAVLIDVIWT
ncbi:hypothetical protein [Actinoplanes sp. NPDC051859]|uniref:hypothetical protein n=1 Tax=Actinoplanes sp. NPDC051859 TaxID=3363909 RepID=UPI0037B376D4